MDKTEEKLNKILIVVGPSGVGKDTLMQKVFEKYPGFFKKGVTHTSRKMREGEKEGFNYYYVSKEEFLKLDSEGGLVEHNFYNGNYYGLSKMELEKGLKGDKIMYAIIDINGANSVFNLKIYFYLNKILQYKIINILYNSFYSYFNCGYKIFNFSSISNTALSKSSLIIL